MITAPRLFARPAVALCGSALLAFSGCSSSNTSTMPPKAGLDSYTIGVTVVNESPKCAWITPYWSNKLAPWHIFSGDKVRPRFVEAGARYNFAYLVIPKNPIAPSVEMKVRAEVKDGPGCGGGNVADTDAVNKYLKPPEGILEACARVKFENGGFRVTQPVQNPDCKSP